jgi:hypothetical protein
MAVHAKGGNYDPDIIASAIAFRARWIDRHHDAAQIRSRGNA